MPRRTQGTEPLKTVAEKEFYRLALIKAEQLELSNAGGCDGLDGEIAVMRIKIKRLLELQPDNIQLLIAANASLTKMVKAKYAMSAKEKVGLGEAIKNIIKDIGVPLGVAVINKKF